MFKVTNSLFWIIQDQYDLVMCGINSVYTKLTKKLTMTENFWSEFSYCGIRAVFKNWYMNCYKSLSVIPSVWLIPEATRNDLFNWYTTGIRLCGMCMMTFLQWFLCQWNDGSVKSIDSCLKNPQSKYKILLLSGCIDLTVSSSVCCCLGCVELNFCIN